MPMNRISAEWKGDQYINPYSARSFLDLPKESVTKPSLIWHYCQRHSKPGKGICVL